jgi:hypothetical protein
MPRSSAVVKSATQTKYYPFNGGLDVVTPALSVDPGFALSMVNYEPWYNGGYRRIDGNERFDGHAKPSLGTSYGVQLSSLAGITGVGTSTATQPNAYQPGTGVTSGATAIVVAAVTTYTYTVTVTGTVTGTATSTQYYIALTNISGTFATGEYIYVGTTTSTGTILTVPSVGYGPAGTGTDGYLYTSEFLFGAQNYYRQQINPVPGTGNILGVWQNGTNIYAIRGTSTNTNTAALMYRSSGTGWTTSGLTYAPTLYYSGLATLNASFQASLDQTGVMTVSTMTAGTIYVGGTIADVTGLVPIGATVIAQLGTATGQTGQYQLSIVPQVPVASENMSFANPTANLPAAGQVVTGVTSHSTATVAYTIPQDTQSGYIAFNGPITGGTGFTTNEALQTVIGGTGTTFGTAAANSVVFALPGGTQGFYRFENANFYATSSTYNVYAVNGAGPAFQIDQNQLIVPILMPLVILAGQPPTNTPFALKSYQGFLFLAFPGGIYQQSVAGSPLQFDGFLGAAEFSVGDEITGLFSMTGPNLIIPTKHSSYALAGNSDATFVQSLIAEKAGAIKFSGQLLDTVYAIGNLGITSLSRTQSYGDFVGSTVSQLVQPLITTLRPNFNDSTIVRASNQVRFYFNDGSCLIMYVPGLGQQNKAWSAIESGVTAQFGYASYPSPVFCIYNSEDQNNLEVGYFGYSNGNGYVYQDRSGTSFDGVAITSYVRLAFNNVGTPAVRKYFRRGDLEINAQAQIALKFAADFSYSNQESSSAVQNLTAANIPVVNVFGGGAFWDTANWNSFLWDGQTISTARALINGTGENVSFLIFHQAVVDIPFVLQGMLLYFDPRRLTR